MRVGIYARVSTPDKNQNVETQLRQLRQFAEAQPTRQGIVLGAFLVP